MQSEKIKEYYKKKHVKEMLVKKYINLQKISIIHRIINNLRVRSFYYLNKFKMNHMEILGCSAIELENHLRCMFTESMTMENYGDWELDHIKPISKFDLTLEEETKKCFHYTNIQPLWMIDNRKKFNKY